MRRPEQARSEEISYADFGRAFFETAVTQARVEAALADMAGNEIDFGPKNVGPAGLASITAKGELLKPEVTPGDGEKVVHYIGISVRLKLTVRVAAHDHVFYANLRTRLELIARAVKPLGIFVDVPAPSADEVEVELDAQGLRASVLEVIAGVEDELRRFMARQVAKQIEEPSILELREIDVAERIAAGYDGPG